MTTASTPDYRPSFPDGPLPGIGILGCGGIARSAHLPAYAAHGLHVVGAWSRTPSAVPGVRRIYPTAQDLLDDPAVGIVDIATPVAGRLDWIAAAVDAGKHVLAQKPLTDDLDALTPILAEADRRGLRIAVNQNGRWAPAWRLATLLVQDGAIGGVVSVTHVHDKPLPPVASTPSEAPEHQHLLLSDYLVHWFDIVRCWLAGKEVVEVAARDGRLPGQPAELTNPWWATARVVCADGTHALLHIPANGRTRSGSCPFWIHGTEGTIRGSVLLGSDFLELDRGDQRTRYALEGQWFVDGFAGTMGELMHAIAKDREPYNSAAHNIGSLALVGAAADSAAAGGSALTLRLML